MQKETHNAGGPRVIAWLAVATAAVILGACGGGETTPGPAGRLQEQANDAGVPMPQPGEQLTAPEARVRADGTPNGGYAIDTTDRQAVKLFYRTVFNSSAGVPDGFTGDVSTCNAGDISPDYRAAVLRRVNWFRAMAGVPANIQLDATENAKAQQAALMMAANNALNHNPPTTWLCYTADGADGAGHSNLDLTTALPGVTDGYIGDPGANNYRVGHRRWELYPQAQYMGVGSVPGADALWVMGSFAAQRPAVRDDFVAWPPRGYVPYQVVYPRWSLSYPNADFSAATVTMTENGNPIATTLEALSNPFSGENTIVWFPGSYTDGSVWARPAADTVYQVTVANVLVGGTPRTFSYTTTVFDGDEQFAATQLTGPSSLAATQQGSYSIVAPAETTAWQWRSLVGTAYSLQDGAESGAGNFTVSTTPGYNVVSTDTSASGAYSFHLAGTTDQVLQLTSKLIFGATSTLTFDSRLGYSTPIQVGSVEVSLDDGASWLPVWQQSGAYPNAPETSFTSKSVSLAAYAGRIGLLRFHYGLSGGGAVYSQTTSGFGWYIDNVALRGMNTPSFVGGAVATPTQFTFEPGQSGSMYLQARGGAYGQFLDWGPLAQVDVAAVGASPTDCLFNWAEHNYPNLLTPAGHSNTSGPYYYRSYANAPLYVGVSSVDNHVYMLNAAGMQDLGARDGWMKVAACPAT